MYQNKAASCQMTTKLLRKMLRIKRAVFFQQIRIELKCDNSLIFVTRRLCCTAPLKQQLHFKRRKQPSSVFQYESEYYTFQVVSLDTLFLPVIQCSLLKVEYHYSCRFSCKVVYIVFCYITHSTFIIVQLLME